MFAALSLTILSLLLVISCHACVSDHYYYCHFYYYHHHHKIIIIIIIIIIVITNTVAGSAILHSQQLQLMKSRCSRK